MPNHILVICIIKNLYGQPTVFTERFQKIIRQKIHKGWVANGNSNVLGKIDDEFLDLAKNQGVLNGSSALNPSARNR